MMRDEQRQTNRERRSLSFARAERLHRSAVQLHEMANDAQAEAEACPVSLTVSSQ
jgi:hypothetical protein